MPVGGTADDGAPQERVRGSDPTLARLYLEADDSACSYHRPHVTAKALAAQEAVLGTTDPEPDQQMLLHHLDGLISELDRLQQHLGQLDRLAEALLAGDDPTDANGPTRRAFRALRGITAAYARAYEAARDNAAAVRDELDQSQPSV